MLILSLCLLSFVLNFSILIILLNYINGQKRVKDSFRLNIVFNSSDEEKLQNFQKYMDDCKKYGNMPDIQVIQNIINPPRESLSDDSKS